MTTATLPATDLKLERETCSRCGGCGEYSYCQMYGTRCFKCGGKGVVLTKRGAAANAYLKALRCKPASEIKPGDVIDCGSIFKGGWGTVTQVADDPHRAGTLVIAADKLTRYGVSPDEQIQIRQTAEQNLATLRQAIEYQSTLTKAGTPRKAR